MKYRYHDAPKNTKAALNHQLSYPQFIVNGTSGLNEHTSSSGAKLFLHSIMGIVIMYSIFFHLSFEGSAQVSHYV
jgi:hypothetical protein